LPARTRKNAKNGNGNGNASPNENFAAALTEVSDRLTKLVQDEIELAKTEVVQKASSLARGAAAVAAGAVFGVFAVVFFLLTLAWVFDGIFVNGAGSLWLGFLIVLVILLVLTVGAFLFAWKKLKVGAPTPKMAIDEGKKIKDTVAQLGNGTGNGNGNGHATPERFGSIMASVEGASLLPPAPPAVAVPASTAPGALATAAAPPTLIEPAPAAPEATSIAALTTSPEVASPEAASPEAATSEAATSVIEPLDEPAADPTPDGDAGTGAEN
jgi:hypothetical protein